MSLDKKYLKRFENQIVQIIYKDSSRVFCYVDHVGSESLTYKTKLDGVNGPEHFSGLHTYLPEIKFDEIENIERLFPESEILRYKLEDIGNKLEQISRTLNLTK